jgi:hypothetical protein
LAAVASASTAGATPAGATATTIAAAIRARASFVHGDRASAEIGPVQGLDGGIGLRVVRHLDETESAQTSTELIADEIYFAHGSVFSKCLFQIVFTGAEGKISHVDIQERCPSFREKSTASPFSYSYQTQAGAALEEGSLSAGSSVELGLKQCTPLSDSVPVERENARACAANPGQQGRASLALYGALEKPAIDGYP